MTDAINEIVAGLRRPRKTISPKYFYDERGSQLFEDITALPEYYLTDAEPRDHARVCRRNGGTDRSASQLD
jgi:uncharacterized SAM-dependent methyltransferase